MCTAPTARAQEAVRQWVQDAFNNVLTLGHQSVQRTVPTIAELYPPYSAERRALLEHLRTHFGDRVFTREELFRAIEAYAQAPFDKSSLRWFLAFLKRANVLRSVRAYSPYYQMVGGAAAGEVTKRESAAPTLKDMLQRRRMLLQQIEQATQALKDLEVDIRRKAEEELGEDGLELLLQITKE